MQSMEVRRYASGDVDAARMPHNRWWSGVTSIRDPNGRLRLPDDRHPRDPEVRRRESIAR